MTATFVVSSGEILRLDVNREPAELPRGVFAAWYDWLHVGVLRD